MIGRQRKGIALIMVVLIAALFLISIIGISAKVTSEKKVSVARSSSERALVAAETGLSQTLFDLRNTHFKSLPDYPADVILPLPDDPSNPLHYLIAGEVKDIVKNGGGHVDCGEHPYSSGPTDVPFVTYHVKIERLHKGTADEWDPDSGPDGDKDVYAEVYSLGTVYRDSTKAEVLARRVVAAECKICYHKESSTTSESSSEVFKYGLFSGTDITFGGGAQEVNGDIYAGGNIDLGTANQVRVKNGRAYAKGDINAPTNGGTADGGTFPGADEIPFPQLDVNYYKGLAYKFKTGQAPYDGSESGYPDCSDPLVQAVVQSYLGSSDTGNTVDEIRTFYSDLMAAAGTEDGSGSGFNALKPDQVSDLQTNAKSIVYYVNPAPGDGTGTASINSNFTCQGTIVIYGNLSLNGNANIDNGGGLAILVDGDINRSNGTATLNGLFYATGGLDFGGGNFTCNGSIVTQDPINITGSYTVNYQSPPSTMPNLNIITTVTENGISLVEQTPSSWKEVSYEEFENPPTP